MDLIDGEVLATLRDDILRPSVVERAVALVLEELSPRRIDERQAEHASELAALDVEQAALMATITQGGDVELLVRLVSRLQALQARRVMLTRLDRGTARWASRRRPVGLRHAFGRSSPTGARS
jgi:hypothetical protein